jgi:hemerythrin superfamily protein
MDAIEMLEEQHRDVEDLFEEFEQAEASEKRDLFEEIADQLSVHATIEERHFYPAVKEKRTEDILLEALEEHLGIKRVIADCLELDAKDETFDAKVKVLKELVEHHVEEEEKDLFPKVRKIMSSEELLAIAQEMAATQDNLLEAGDPRELVRGETAEAPSLG